MFDKEFEKWKVKTIGLPKACLVDFGDAKLGRANGAVFRQCKICQRKSGSASTKYKRALLKAYGLN